MPEFRYIQLTNSLSTDAVIYPTVTIDGQVITASDQPTQKDATVNYDLAGLVGSSGEASSVAIGAFVAAPNGRQAESGSFMTLTNRGDIQGYFELTGGVDGPTMNFNGYGDAK